MARLDEVSKAIGALQASAEKTEEALKNLGHHMEQGFNRVATSVGETKTALDAKLGAHAAHLGKHDEKLEKLAIKQAYWSGGIAASTTGFVLLAKHMIEKWFTHGP